jgi:hypothetical protein
MTAPCLDLFRSIARPLVVAAALAGLLSLAAATPGLPSAPTPARPAGAEAAMGPLRVHPANGRYFADPRGAAVYLTGSHTWTSLVDRGSTDPPAPFDYEGYLDRLVAHGHNFIRLWAWELVRYRLPGEPVMYVAPSPHVRSGPGLARDGKPRFDLTRFDEAYFDRLRARVEAARRRGLYVSVMLFEAYGARFAVDAVHPMQAENNVNDVDGDRDGDGRPTEVHTLVDPAVTAVQKAYVRKVVDTLADLDNVLYEIANEGGPESTGWQHAMVEHVRAAQRGRPHVHPVGLTFQYKGGRNATLMASTADWISPGWTRAENYRSDPPPATGRKVIVSDTDHHWGVGGDRVWVWKSFLRGHNPIYMDPLDDDPGRQGARAAMGQTLAFARRVDLAAMTPEPSLASTGYCLAGPREYLVYAPAGGRVTVDLSAVRGRLVVEWFRPATGAASPGGTVAGGGRRTLRAPFRGDAVLYLRAG